MPPPDNNPHLFHPRYRADIDGLRAIAVLAVVGFHAFPEWIRGGFVGVDIFFVISGFLISSIILNSLEAGTFSFVEFYVRRANRIFPALILVMAASYLFGWFALLPDEYRQLSKHIVASAGFLSNFFFWQEAGYFDNAAATKPLLHLWSLGVEEQFYILWPLLLYSAWKRHIGFLIFIVILMGTSFADSIAIRSSDPVQAFYSPLSRFWELLVGGILAYLTMHGAHFREAVLYRLYPGFLSIGAKAKQKEALLNNVQSVMGALLIGISVVLISRQMAFPGWWALLPVTGAYLVISAGQHAWLNRVFLSNRLLVWIGLISYPLYLWHWPFLSFARIMESQTPSAGIRFAAVVLATMLAWLTYRFVERPVRFFWQSSGKTQVLALLMFLLAGVGYATYVQDGLKERFSEQLLAQVDALGKAKHWFVWSASACPGAPDARGCRILDPNRPPEVALLGDSHAMHLVFGLGDIYGPRGVNIVTRARPGCSVFLPHDRECKDFMSGALNGIAESKSIHTVILGDYGVAKIEGGNWLPSTMTLPKNQVLNNEKAYRSEVFSTLRRLVASGKRVIFIVDTPDLYFDPEVCVRVRPMYLLGHEFKHPCSIGRDEFDHRVSVYHRVIDMARTSFPSVKFIDAWRAFCGQRQCHVEINGQLMYRDHSHLNVAGSRYLGSWMATQLIR